MSGRRLRESVYQVCTYVCGMCTWKHESDLCYNLQVYIRTYMCKCVLVHEVSVYLQEQSMRVVLTSAKKQVCSRS